MIKPTPYKGDRFTEAVRKEFVGHLIDLQAITGFDSLELACIMGNAFGHAFACTDCGIEKEHNIKDGSEHQYPMKQTFMLNFETAYNEHRSHHENQKCKVKPEPKIV